MSYADFLARKLAADVPTGIAEPPALNDALFPFQRDLVRLALKRGRFALFADTGLGKGWMALEWCRVVAEHAGRPVLLLAPLAVSHQFAREAAKLGVAARVVATQADVAPGINVTNYHKLQHFDASTFGGVALDESSILKDETGAFRTMLIETFAATPFRLALTATPAPNDHTELGNHAEFLGVMSRVEMLSKFFCHDGGSTQDWRIKGHAQDQFWRWVASWAATLRRPSDLGYDDGAYALPPLEIREHIIAGDIAQAWASGSLFVEKAEGLTAQRAARKGTIEARVAKAVELAKRDEKVLIWCELNAEQDALAKALGSECVSIAGATPEEKRIEMEARWREGDVRVLITKPSLFGHGLNWQHCAHEVFVGVSHSFEQFYQAVRRCYRFGQTRPVTVDVVSSELEGAVVDNLRRKQEDAATMGDAMVRAMADITRADVQGMTRTMDRYEGKTVMRVPSWLVANVEAA